MTHRGSQGLSKRASLHVRWPCRFHQLHFPTAASRQDDSTPQGLQMGITVLMLQNVLFLSCCFPSWSVTSSPGSPGLLGVTITFTVSPPSAHLSTRHPATDNTLVQTLDLSRLVLQGGYGLSTDAFSTPNPGLASYREAVWCSGLWGQILAVVLRLLNM